MNDILTDTEVAEMLDCETSTAQAMARDGKVPAIKAGRSWRFPRAALIEALNDQARKNMQRPTEAPKAVKVKVRPVLVDV